MSENMSNEAKAIEIIKSREPEENFQKAKDLEGYDLKGKTKLVEVKYRKIKTPVHLQEAEYHAYKKYDNYWIYFVHGDLDNPEKVEITKFSKEDLKNRIPDKPHTVVYRLYPNKIKPN